MLTPLSTQLADRIRAALAALGSDADPQLMPAQDEKFGHYQSNCAMALAKQLQQKPRDLAAALVEKLDAADLCDPPEIAGPGFINFRIRPAALAAYLRQIPPCPDPAADRVGIPPSSPRQTVVIDLSSPNLAKEMHVGHLRSTVIGDCVARVLEFAGHNVIRENHVGDWGTQFGMLLAHLRRVMPDVAEHPDWLVIADLEAFYVAAKRRFDEDEEFRKESRDTVVALQRGDEPARTVWRAFCAESLRHCHALYDRLDVKLLDRGESYYNELMDEVIRRMEQLRAAQPEGPVRESEGALCVFLDGWTTREGEPLPLIARKSDGGYNYATSDLATILHRVESLGADRILYVVGLPQKQHLEMVFAAARRLGWVRDDIGLTHIAFGSMLNQEGRPFKTREGGTVKLRDLLDEAVARARTVVVQGLAEEDPPRQLSDGQIDHIAETVGIAAVKYFDLSHALSSDYKFDLDTMLSLEGNTAPYMMYAVARVRAIGRKGNVDFAALPVDRPLVLEHPTEVRLALALARFAETFETVARDLRPNLLTDYLYDLARAFSRFYDKKLGVRVLDATPEEARLTRLRLCDLTARTLTRGLWLLGIPTLEYM